MKRLVFDIEADDLLEGITEIHCAATYDLDSEEIRRYSKLGPLDGHLPIQQLPYDLSQADWIIGHNIINYDNPAIYKILVDESLGMQDKFNKQEGVMVLDTMIMSRVVWADITSMDYVDIAKGSLVFPPRKKGDKRSLIGSHSLKAWGYRLGFLKGNEDGEVDFKTYTPEMLEYCVRDVLLTVKLYRAIAKKEPNLDDCIVPYSFWLEHQFFRYLEIQMAFGVSFDKDYAEKLCFYWEKELEKRVIEMRRVVPNILVETPFTPKVNNKTLGYVKGETVTKSKIIQFNPKSSAHIIEFFTKVHGWVPTEYTKKTPKHPNGQVKVEYDILANLPYPEAPLLARIRLLMDRLNLVKNGKGAWFKSLRMVDDEWRIFGRINHNGTNTSRCKHSGPNLGNIPSTKAIWGRELRRFYKAKKGYVLLGVDADALEMRALAEVLYDLDGGKFYEMAFNGSKEDGTDAHSLNRKATQELLRENRWQWIADALSRDTMKTIFYAFLYGSFEKNLAEVAINGDKSHKVVTGALYRIGGLIKAGLMKNIPELEEFVESLKEAYDKCINEKQWPHLMGVDGRKIPVRKKFAVLNCALQALGAIIMKLVSVILLHKLEASEYGDAGYWWRPVLHVHDELQIECREEARENIQRMALDSFVEAGKLLGLRIPILGSAAFGPNWAKTH